MDVFFFGDAIMAVVTKFGPGGGVGEGMAVSISFVTKRAGIVAFGQGTVDEGTGAEVRMALLSPAGASWFDGLWCLPLLGEQHLFLPT